MFCDAVDEGWEEIRTIYTDTCKRALREHGVFIRKEISKKDNRFS